MLIINAIICKINRKTKIMKVPVLQTALVVTTSLFFGAKAIAQQPDFLFEQSYPFEWQYAGSHTLEICTEEGETECFFVAACDLTTIGYTTEGKGSEKQPDITQPAKVLKLSPEGELLGEMMMNEVGRSSSVIQLYRDPSDPKYCLAIGVVLDSTLSYTKPYLARFDHALNLSWRKEIELPEAYRTALCGGRCLMDSSGNIVFCTWPYVSSYYSNILYIRLSFEGDLLALGSFPQNTEIVYSAQGGLFEYEDGSGDYGQPFVGEREGWNNPPVFLLRMNRDFSDFQTYDLPEDITIDSTDGIFIGERYAESFATALHDGTKYLSTRGHRWDGWNGNLDDDVIVFMKLDQNDSIVALSFVPHDNDSVRTLAFCHGMDMSSNESFFVCNGVYDSYEWDKGLNHFVVSKMDSNANFIWRRYYEDGEHVFQPCSVTATADNGCLVSGRCWTLDYSEAFLFVLKFFPDGTLAVPEGSVHVRPYMFYPNPTQGQLHLQYSPDVQPAQIELYDLQGRLVRSQGNNFETFGLGTLPAGTYTLRVTMADGQVFSDKVVKE